MYDIPSSRNYTIKKTAPSGEFTNIPSKEGIGYIYHIYNCQNELLYIGHTINLLERVGCHLSRKEAIYTVQFWEVKISEMLNLEATHIISFHPIQNQTLPKNSIWFSFSTYKKINPHSSWDRRKLKKLMKKFDIQYVWSDYLHIETWEALYEKFLEQKKGVKHVSI